MKLLKNKKEVFEILREGRYETRAFRKAVEKAYMSGFDIKVVGNDVIFEQGSGRSVRIPLDIVEEIIGCPIAA